MMNNSTEKFKGHMKNWFVEFVKGQTFTMIVVLIILTIVFTSLNRNFLTISNFLVIGQFMSLSGILACGCTLAVLMGGMEFSQWSTAAWVGVLAATFSNNGMNDILVILISIAIGAAVGFFNGFCVTKLRILPIITTMGSQMIVRGLAYISTKGSIITLKSPNLLAIGQSRIMGVPNLLLYYIVAFVIFAYVMKYTTLGRKLFAVGGNSYASYLSGINADQVRMIAYLICGLSSGIVGLLAVCMYGNGMPMIGQGAEFDVTTGVLLGGISLAGGKGKLSGTVMGVMVLAVITNGMAMLNISSYYQLVVRGTILIVAVFVDTLRGKGYR